MKRVFAAAAAAILVLGVAGWVSAAPVTGPLKWSQPAYQIGADAAGNAIYWGWDQPSWSFGLPPNGPQAADDWLCRDNLPVTDFHWWGSYIGKLDPVPLVKPAAFWFGIYTDIPVQPGIDYSRPGQLIWSYVATNYIETFVGWDVDVPDPAAPPHDATFQYNVYLPQSDWFYQPGSNNILWLSIVAVFPAGGQIQEWGWKTRPHYFQDDAVRSYTGGWSPIYGPDGLSWDLSFELSTIPEPSSLLVFASGAVGLIGLKLRKRR